MIRKAFRMTVNAGATDEYERRHRQIWKELEDVLFDHGVCSYSIYLDPESRSLFGYVEVESEELWAQVAATSVCQRWWRYMRDVMDTNGDDSPVSRDLREVFHIERPTPPRHPGQPDVRSVS